MKKLQLSSTLIYSFLLMVFLGACVKDDINRIRTYSFYTPVYKTKAQVKADVRSHPPIKIVNPGKLFVLGNYIFLNEVNKGIHIINNQNPSSPKNVAFIDIPGNMDLAVKGNALYADLYTDLVTLDISDPMQVSVKKITEGVFPFRYYGGYATDSSRIIVDWIRHDTTISEKLFTRFQNQYSYPTVNYAANSAPSKNATGIGGSMARFAIVSDWMYTVSNNDLNVFDISRQFDPGFSGKVSIGNQLIETIFPFSNKLFIGSQSGMFVYNIARPDQPSLAGQFGHVRSCDPVIADDKYAMVTLRSGNACAGFANQLDVLELNDYTNLRLIKSYPFTNPHGLAMDGNLLFVCDGKDGLKIFNASNVNELKLVKHYSGIETYDVVASGNIAIVVAKEGLYQFNYSDANHIRQVSKLGIGKY